MPAPRRCSGAGPGRGVPDDRQLLGQVAGGSRRGDHHPDAVRSGESEYAINGAPCRLLDIQELLSDSGVGRQQHMIVGQGQLDTVLNARPEDRRAIIEEAAGVLKHRRRRERAERRLAATAENLERLGDLVREVRRQIRPLERQAAAARSHDVVASRAPRTRRYLAGAELTDLRSRRRAASQGLAVCRKEEQELHEALLLLDAEATSTTAELSSRREEAWPRLWRRVQGLVERARGQLGRATRSGDGRAAALDAAADVDVVSTLEVEAAHLAAELASAEAEQARTVPQSVPSWRRRSARLDEDAAALREGWTDLLGEAADPDEAIARARARNELVARSGSVGTARHRRDWDPGGRTGTGSNRRRRPRRPSAKAAADLEQATASLEADLTAATTELESDCSGGRDGAGRDRRGRRCPSPSRGQGRGSRACARRTPGCRRSMSTGRRGATPPRTGRPRGSPPSWSSRSAASRSRSPRPSSLRSRCPAGTEGSTRRSARRSPRARRAGR